MSNIVDPLDKVRVLGQVHIRRRLGAIKSEILRAEWPVSNFRGFGKQQCVRFTSWSSIAWDAPAKAETMVCNLDGDTVFEFTGKPRRAAVVSKKASFVFVDVRNSMR